MTISNPATIILKSLDFFPPITYITDVKYVTIR
jgi:hypothetical protein